MTPDTADTIWRWFQENRHRLDRAQPEETSELFSEMLSSIDGRVGVEVAAEDGGGKEVIFTAGGDVNAFETIHRIVASAPEVQGWTFVALKPAAGFDFSIRTGEASIDAGRLQFEPLESDRRPGELGILLLFPQGTDLAIAGDIALLIVETGVGEEAVARISHLQVDYASAKYPKALPVSDLGEYIAWHLKRYSH